MEVRLALSISRNRQRQGHSDGYAQPHAHSNEDFDPRIEWREGPHSYILLVYVPGFKKENLMVEMDDTRTMTISGERRFEQMVMVGWTWHRLERRGQSFTKQLTIPANVNMDAVAGRFEPGILYIIMPKLPSSSEGGISNYGLEEPPEDDAPPTSPRPDLESSDTKMPVGIRIEDVSLQPEEAPSPDTDDPSHQIPEIPDVIAPSDQSPGSGSSEDQVPYQVESPDEEIHPPSVSMEAPATISQPKDSDEGITASPPELPEAADRPLDIQSLPEADENMATADDGIPSPSPDHRAPPFDQIQEHPQGPVASTPPRTPRGQQPPIQLQNGPRPSPPGTPPQTPKGQQPPTLPQHHPPESPPGTPPQTPKEPQPPTQLEHRPPQTPPGTPPQTPKEPQSTSELHHQAEKESHDSSLEEPSPPQIPPNPVESPDQAEELEKQVEDSGTYTAKQEDASPASDSEPSDHMQPPIPPVEEHAKDEEKEEKIDEVEEEEDGLKPEEQPCGDRHGCCCKKYAVLSFLALAVVAFIALHVRCKG